MKIKPKIKTKNKNKNQNESKNENENENENKNENEKQNKNKNENENENGFSFLFSFCFSLSFLFLFLLSKGFCTFVNSTWTRGAIDGQLCLDWLRSGIAFLYLHVTQRCHRRSTLSYFAQKCHSIFVCKFPTWPSGAIDRQLSLSLLIDLEVPQHLEVRNIWSKKSKLPL